MATKYKSWKGNAPAQTHVNDVTPAGVTSGNIFTITLNSEPDKYGALTSQSEQFTATAATVANVTAGLTDAVNNSTQSFFADITAVDGSTKLTLTKGTLGIPMNITVSSADGTGSAGHSITEADVTRSGPSDFGADANWEDEAGAPGAPISSDINYLIYNDGDAADCRHGLFQGGIAPASITRSPNFTGDIGDPANGYFLFFSTLANTTAMDYDTRDGGSSRIRCGFGNIITKGQRETESLQLSGKVKALRAMGGSQRGEITIIDGTQIDDVYLIGSAAGRITIEPNCVQLNGIRQVGGGIIENSSDVDVASSVIEIIDGVYRQQDGKTGNAAISVWGSGVIYYNAGDGDQAGPVVVNDGEFTLRDNPKAELTIAQMTLNGVNAVFDRSNATPNVSIPGGTENNGGTVKTK